MFDEISEVDRKVIAENNYNSLEEVPEKALPKKRYPKPLHNKVIVIVTKVPEKIGSIILSEASQEELQRKERTGLVVAIGPKVESEIALGDLVQFGEYCGVETVADGVEYLTMSEKDVLAVLPPIED